MVSHRGEHTSSTAETADCETKEFRLSTDSEHAARQTYFETREKESTWDMPGSRLSYSSYDFYYRELSTLPLLSAEEERELAKRIYEGKRQVKNLLLQSPVGLEWIAEAVHQMEEGEIRPKDVMEIPCVRNKESESQLIRQFISRAKQILEIGGQSQEVEEKAESIGHEDHWTTKICAHPQIVIHSLFDGIQVKPDILGQLERKTRNRANPNSRQSEKSRPDSSAKRLTGILSAVQSSRHEIREAKDKLVKANLRLVVHVARKYVNFGVSLSDLIQEGNIGLMKAVDRFDYRKGYKFSTFASWWIVQGITRGIAYQGRLIRIPVHRLEDKMKISKISHDLSGRLGRKPTLSELADEAELPLEEVKKLAHISTEEPVSLHAPLKYSGTQIIDFIVDENGTSPLDAVMHNDLRDRIREVLVSLKPREARIVRKRFGIDEKRNYTMEELGRQFGVSKERIRQIQKKAMMKLEHPKRKRALEGLYE